MAPSQEELAMTPTGSAAVVQTGPSPCNSHRDLTPVTIQADEEPEAKEPGALEVEVDEPDGNLISRPGQVNEFAVRRTTAQNMLDLALFAANVSQLRGILAVGPVYLDFYDLALWCVCLSLGCQVLFSMVVLVLKIREDQMDAVLRDTEGQTESQRPTRDRLPDILNYFSTVLVLFVLLLNIVISVFVNARKNNSPADKIVDTFTRDHII